MPFDIIGAKQAGYSDTDIAKEMSRQFKFNYYGARRAGHTDQAIIGEMLSKTDAGTAPAHDPNFGGVSLAGGSKPVSTLGIATPRQRQEAADLKQSMETPTAPAASVGDFVTRVVPESAAKLAVNTFKAPAALAGDIAAPLAAGDIGEGLANAGQVAKGVVDAVTKPIGLQGLEAAKEAWTTDPAGSVMALTAVKPIAKATAATVAKGAGIAGDLGAGFLGTTTGTSKNMIKQAVTGGDDFARYMRAGEEGGADIVSKAKEALQMVRDERGNAYRASLDEIGQNTAPIADAPQLLNDALARNLQRFGVKMVDDGTGTMKPDFSRSTFNKNSHGDVANIIDTVQSWGTKQGDLTPLGLDTLKRQLDDFYSESKNSRAMVTDLRNRVKGMIVDRVPEYANMTKAYEEATKTIGEFERTLSLGKKPAIDTTLRKLTQSMRDNFQFRKEILDNLATMTGENLQDMIAGYNMSSWAPQGGFGKLTAGGSGAGMALTQSITPGYLSLLATSSPRLVGESLRALGMPWKVVNRVYKKMPQIRSAVNAIGKAIPNGGAPAVAAVAGNAYKPKSFTYQNGELIPDEN